MFLSLTIKDIVRETDDAASFFLERTDGKTLVYKPGQFLTFVFSFQGREVRRSYSFSSTPGVDAVPRITVKRIPNGEISRYFLQRIQKGDVLQALPPAGLFTFDEDISVQRDVFLLAAGSGMTPVFSLLKHLLEKAPHFNIVLVYQNHSEESTLFRDELRLLSVKKPGSFTWIDYTSPRHVNNELLEQLILASSLHRREDALFFTCGPVLFMNMCRFSILTMGYQAQQVKREFFIAETPPPPPPVPDPAPRKITVLLDQREISFIHQYPSSILESAIAQGIPLPYSCRNGRCSSCAAHCIEGRVVMSNNEVLTDRELRQGLVLTCTGYALSDIVLRYDH